MEVGDKFLVQHDFNPGDDNTKLLLKAGDIIDYLCGEVGDDWWYGKLFDREGWFPSTYGAKYDCVQVKSVGTDETIDEDTYHRNLTPDDRKQALRRIFNTMIVNEQYLCDKIRSLVSNVVEPMLVRDSSFKREFMQEYSIAVLFSVIQDIETASSEFLKTLRQASVSDTGDPCFDKVATCFKDYSPSLRLFSQYTLEISNVFNSLKKFNKPLNQFLKSTTLPQDLPMEEILVLPVDHYATYLENLKCFCCYAGRPTWDGASINDNEYKILSEALSTMAEYSREVDETLEEEKEKQLLLVIQNRCKLIDANLARMFNVLNTVINSFE